MDLQAWGKEFERDMLTDLNTIVKVTSVEMVNPVKTQDLYCMDITEAELYRDHHGLEVACGIDHASYVYWPKTGRLLVINYSQRCHRLTSAKPYNSRLETEEYLKLCSRTECDQVKALRRFVDGQAISPTTSLEAVRLNHAVLGMMGEVGELAGAIERWIYYGKPRDDTNITEELGDLLWYVALACNARGLDLSEVMAANIRKLKSRYPEKYTDFHAAEENRDREAERQALILKETEELVCRATKTINGRTFRCGLDKDHLGLHKSGCGEF